MFSSAQVVIHYNKDVQFVTLTLNVDHFTSHFVRHMLLLHTENTYFMHDRVASIDLDGMSRLLE